MKSSICFENVGDLFLDLVEHPLVDFAGGKDAGVFEVE